ncbi:rod shape-determining protein RodA [Sphingomonas nostoxanthinifaciens]|uniref:rod shape-determining protein RodA n=1 Tax=Sphingomonas nostoxanthinifaciens TaxID=2872652 RepID=UPI001CC1C900|nr:rod shape-determining protein RodA [Sphingomonas nostoxanthinifaciens]UAK23709.1 rod shape-determining protein RodA [Sphingomonas nostoxanthinifaciens]
MSNSLVPVALRRIPWGILFLVAALTGFGLAVLYSAAGGHLMPWALPQGVRFLGFLVGAIVLSRLNERQLKSLAIPAYVALVVLLVGVEALGVVGGGSRRWLDLKIIRLQPSELMKPAIVVALAAFYDHLPAAEVRRFNAIWPAALMIGLPFLLVLVQPDLGTALMIAFGGVTAMFLAGVPVRLFVGAAAAAAALTPIALARMHDYQRSRIEIFLNPESDPLGTGYHIIQSKIAIGSGGVFGKGFLNGTQSHLDYLPEGHTDFAFATMAEEWGLAGGIGIILAYAVVVGWGMRVALGAPTRFGRIAAAGLATTIFFYATINMLMVMGLAPVVGIPLPLISWGGSAMMTVLICLGLLMAIDRHRKPARL